MSYDIDYWAAKTDNFSDNHVSQFFFFLSSTLSSLESDISDMKQFKRSQRDAYFAIDRKRPKKISGVEFKKGNLPMC